MQIKKIAVIGAGVMGMGIAAQIANASREVVLLDLPAKGQDKNANVNLALTKMNEGKVPALTHPNRQKFIQIGNIEDNLEYLRSCDLILEVIIEKIEIKHQLYKKIIPYLKKGVIIASNTSTLLLKDLKTSLSIDIKENFLIIHFFNPPRLMELVELVTDKNNSVETVKLVKQFITHVLGKTVVDCNDTPGFIANRLGCYLLEMVVRRAIAENLEAHIIDQIFTNVFKLPSTGIFGLFDLIGLDVMQLISSSMMNNLPKTDDYHQIFTKSSFLDEMLSKELIGKKAKSGFYRINMQKNQKTIEAINFNDFSYAAFYTEHLFKDLAELLASDNKYAIFIKKILSRFYNYLFSIAEQITDNPADIDLAMKLGYSWKYGPFELLSQMPDLARFIKGRVGSSIYEQITSKAAKKNETKNIIFNDIILSNDDAQLFNYQNKLIFSPLTKINCLTPLVFELLNRAIEYAEQKRMALYIFSHSNNFSAGADLKYIIYLIEKEDFTGLDQFLKLGQQTLKSLKYCKIKTIACAAGFALGGGTEILLHSDYLVLNYGLQAGLIEASIGLLPAFGGTKEMLLRANDAATLVKNIENILKANKSLSADYFVHDYHLDNYCLNMNKHYLLEESFTIELENIKQRNLTQKIIFPKIDLSSVLVTDQYNLLQKELTVWLQSILDKDDLTEDDLLDFERNKFIELSKRPDTLQNIKTKL